MTGPKRLYRLRSALEWLSARGESYGIVMVVFSLNVPFLMAALTRHLEGVGLVSFGALYAGMAFLGYYVFIVLVLLTILFLLTAFSRRLFMGGAAVLLTTVLFYLLINGAVHRVLRLHIDGFWLHYLVTSFGGLGISPAAIAGSLALLCLIAALQLGLFRLATRIRRRRMLVVGLALVSVSSFIASQVIHIAAYEVNDSRILAITPQLPFYYPVTSHAEAVKYGGLLPMIREQDASARGNSPLSLNYPLEEVQCTIPTGHRRPNILMIVLESWRADALDPLVTPRMYDLSKRSSVFLNHFSSGNATPTGVFPLFYGIHSTYWAAVKANSAAIDNPVLINALTDNGYAFGIYADSHFERHKIKDAVFRGIEVHESFDGDTPDANDADLTERLFAFMKEQQSADRPFFGFAFYKSTHFAYDYPEESAIFQPARDLNLVLASARTDPTPYLNDYLNSVHYVDSLVGGLVQRMEEAGILENTIVILTSDHGEEFNDNRMNYWGHTGNFTRYQTHVPLTVYVPWKEPRQVDEVTAHVDVAPTLMLEGLGCIHDVAAHSNGTNLFGPLEQERPMIISSYVNHAVVIGDDVLVVYPMYVKKHKLSDINLDGDTPPAPLMKQAIDEMQRFRGGGKPGS